MKRLIVFDHEFSSRDYKNVWFKVRYTLRFFIRFLSTFTGKSTGVHFWGGHTIRFYERYSSNKPYSMIILYGKYSLWRYESIENWAHFKFSNDFQILKRLRWLHGAILVESESDEKTKCKIASCDRNFKGLALHVVTRCSKYWTVVGYFIYQLKVYLLFITTSCVYDTVIEWIYVRLKS